jgi:hydrogenase/urease accessory protein HupE
MIRLRRLGIALLWLLTISSAWAHRTEIDQVTLVELAKHRYGIRYKAPPPGMSEFAAPLLPAHCHWADGEDYPIEETATSLVFESEDRPLAAEDKIILPWQRHGVLVTAQWSDGSTGRQFFMSSPEGIVVEMSQLRAGSGSISATARRYFMFGLEHILGGIDHLLFVAGLLLLVKGARRLLVTITAFTLAHSITLALSIFGWLALPSEPVEAVIALSIVLLAVENVHQLRGHPALTSRYPWLVSFGFGLVHGLGFAGALGQLGLPSSELPPALLFFNLGVEAGQLLFVAAWFVLTWLLSRLRLTLPARFTLAPYYALGIISTYWLLERTFAMMPG